ncbi:MAG: TIGR03960 family B12-binding radical SAM protein [Deltaproteobacteria bacterium]|nr:TIGR03960 family B12-binding radical SAM protein [Deltaproteobacteria bacterium]
MQNNSEESALYSQLPHVSKASRYLGNEINSVRKHPDTVDITFAFAFPDIYEVGMSHTGLHILYERMNSFDWIACERVFAPWVDMMERMQARGLKLRTLENRLPVRDCDIAGFSIEYELASATVLRMLELSGIPLTAPERDGSWPLIIAGGPCTYNPEPLADFFDAFVIGEGEDVVIELCDAVRSWKSLGPGRDKRALLNSLSAIPGIYVPLFFKTADSDTGLPRSVTPCKPGYEQVTKRIVRGFSHAPACTAPVVPYLQIIHDRAAVEIARGCTRGCRFCMAGMVYRPVREKSAAAIGDLARSCLAASGYEELGLLSLSSSDHSAIHSVLPELMRHARRDMTAVSLPSMRADSLAPDLMEEIKKVRKTGFTIAPEAGTQRLRDVINKGITRDEILATASRIFDAGWNLVKLYFMIGLPTETDQDLDGIVDLARSIAGFNRRKQVTVSISTFVPKPHTPFQWEAQDSADEIVRKQRYLMERLRAKNIQCKCHNHHLSLLEGVFARGDRSLGRLLIEAHRLGAGFESWSEHFKPELWAQAFSRAGIEPGAYLRARPLDAPLPWDHIRCGVSREFLTIERERAFAQRATPDCRRDECQGCGACGCLDARLEIAQQEPADAPSGACTSSDVHDVEAAYRYRIGYSKTGPARFLSHLELTRVFSRALRRAGLPLKYSGGFHPMPRITFHSALPVGLASEEEYCDVLLLRELAAEDIMARCAGLFPEGIRILSMEAIALKNTTVPARMRSYRIRLPADSPAASDPQRSRTLLGRFSACTELPVEMQSKKGPHTVDLKQAVQGLALDDDGSLVVHINPDAERVPRVNDIIGEILELSADERAALTVTKLRA